MPCETGRVMRRVARCSEPRKRSSLSPALDTQTRNLVVYGNQTGTGTAQLPGLTLQQVTLDDAGSNNIRVTALYPFQPLFGTRLPALVGGTQNTLTFNMSIVVTMTAL